MSQRITSLIIDYAFPSIGLEESKRKDLHSLLAPFFQDTETFAGPFHWDVVPVRTSAYTELSHTRSVYIGSSSPGFPCWVAKLETCAVRKKKGGYFFPHAEEIAYKIGAKLLHWNTIPKTKVLHQFSLETAESRNKYKKHLSLMRCFVEKNGRQGFPITFTFQTFVKGVPLPSLRELESGMRDQFPVLPSSYQKAYLLGMILGKGDARGDNTMYSPETGELFEIDNEYFSASGYPSSGVLQAFSHLKLDEIPEEIVEDLLQVQPEQLASMRSKYMRRDRDLAALQAREPIPFRFDVERVTRKMWADLFDNIRFVQEAVRCLRENSMPVTLINLEEEVEKCKWEKRKIEPPLFSGNMLKDIHDWIQMEHCVVLHSNGANSHTYYQGRESIENMRIIYINIASHTGLLNEHEWPEYLKQAGCSLANKALQQILSNRAQPPRPRESFCFRFDYTKTT